LNEDVLLKDVSLIFNGVVKDHVVYGGSSVPRGSDAIDGVAGDVVWVFRITCLPRPLASGSDVVRKVERERMKVSGEDIVSGKVED